MELDATFWAFVALLIFFGIVIYFKVPAFVTKALDSRIAKIEADLDDENVLLVRDDESSSCTSRGRGGHDLYLETSSRNKWYFQKIYP